MSSHALIIDALRQSNTASNAILNLATELDMLSRRCEDVDDIIMAIRIRDIASKIRIEAKKIGESHERNAT